MPFNTPKPSTAFSLQFLRIPKAFHISMDFLNQATYIDFIFSIFFIFVVLFFNLFRIFFIDSYRNL
ncbi:hypothetical protein HanRHA438_Chr14g0670191 [Helianthus annuus]|uniref:Uncharacterized protein n=1 Tax=Helianthus annuus TaxID=4232 RepID=A0A9K3H7G3_HELAN|nr:hypothetical protein HanXRQr2_Chr14g0659311 [Helianthus annuus]KAJ0470118.1 hypothetical protein HanIR_Chr14g0715321 [Helianthus annuus]KAJ0841607.1 hypothetical protein HanPSC8_Chr14g0632341 [Helianthus annuus]KAJ0855144.1 hypothetical protein HanRHA438_Chr14g0670191 [Helianthus annuus]